MDFLSKFVRRDEEDGDEGPDEQAGGDTGFDGDVEAAEFTDVDATDGSVTLASTLPTVLALANYDKPPMTSSTAANVRFNTATEGYHFPQVENYVAQVEETLRWWQEAGFAYRRAVHDLQVELDHQAFDARRLKTEIEVFKVAGSPLVNPDGTYLTESQQARAGVDVAALQDELEQARNETAAAQANFDQARTYAQQLEQHIVAIERHQPDPDGPTGDEASQHGEGLQAELERLQHALNQSVQERDAARTEAQAARDHATQCDAVISALREENEKLLGAVADPPLNPAWNDPDEADRLPTSIIPVDTELPPGVTAPSELLREGASPAGPRADETGDEQVSFEDVGATPRPVLNRS